MLVLQLDRSDQRADGYDQFLERAAWFYEAVSLSAAMKSQMPGAGQAFLGTYTDADGDGSTAATMTSCTSRPEPPAKLFWSVTVYDIEAVA